MLTPVQWMAGVAVVSAESVTMSPVDALKLTKAVAVALGSETLMSPATSLMFVGAPA
jgi:hypothetical protein